MFKHLLNTLVFLLTGLYCSAVPKEQQVTMESYVIERCNECDNSPPKFEEVSEIYHIDDELTELTLTVVGDLSMKDSLTFSFSNDSLNFNYNFEIQSVESSPEEYYWYTIKVILTNFEIPNEYHFMADGIEIYISDYIYYNYISSFEIIEGEIMNMEDYFGRRQGRWMMFDIYQTPSSDLFYADDMAMEGYHWVSYYSNGRLRSYVPVKNGKDLDLVACPFSFMEPGFYSSVADN